jgi:hypothetical protein
VDKRFALNVEENFMEDLVLAKNKLTNNLKNGSEEKIYNYVLCVKLTLRKVKVAITWLAIIVSFNSAGFVEALTLQITFNDLTLLDVLGSNFKMLIQLLLY